MPSIESNQLLLTAAAACEDKKAEDIRILALDPAESGLTDYFLICNGTNERQNVAITDEVELRLKREFGVYPNSVEGRRQGEWVLMDYVDLERISASRSKAPRKSASAVAATTKTSATKSGYAKKKVSVKTPAKKAATKTAVKAATKAAVKSAKK